VNFDVLNLGHLEQRLQPPIAEDRILNGTHVRQFLSRGPQVGTFTMQRSHVVSDNALDDGSAQQQPIIIGKRPAYLPKMIFIFLSDHRGRSPPKLDNMSPVDS
jgi:hypothetical protein